VFILGAWRLTRQINFRASKGLPAATGWKTDWSPTTSGRDVHQVVMKHVLLTRSYSLTADCSQLTTCSNRLSINTSVYPLPQSRRLPADYTKTHHVELSVSISPSEGNCCSVVGTINPQCSYLRTPCHQYHHFIITATHIYLHFKPMANSTVTAPSYWF